VVATTDLDLRVQHLRRQGSQLTNSGRPAAGARKLRTALRILQWPAETVPHGAPAWQAHARLTSQVLISLGLAEAELGDTARGLATLDAAGRIITDADRAILLQQRGLVLQRAGRIDEALPLLDAAIPRLMRADEPFALTSALLNRALLLISIGRIRRAREDLHHCRSIAVRHDYVLTTAKVEHDLGYCALLDGDIPAALQAFEAASDIYALHGPGYLPVVVMDRARALLAAGLAREASQELDTAFILFSSDRLDVDYAWAQLTRAQTALAAGDPQAATRWATNAGRRFRRHGDHAWAAVADLAATQALVLSGNRADKQKLRDLAARLRELGLRHDADFADLLMVRMTRNDGKFVTAPALLRRSRPGAPLEVRLLRKLLLAQAHRHAGAHGRALGVLRAGLALLQSTRERWGSIEMRVATSRLGVELAHEGLDIAISTGTPAHIFSWAERCRAQAFRVRPVHPPADSDVREALAELRQLGRNARLSELRGNRDLNAEARRRQLEHLVRQRSWQLRGGGRARDLATLARVQSGLGDHLLVSLIDQHGQLLALVADHRRARLVRLGSTAAATSAVQLLLGDLDAVCGRKLPQRIEAAINHSARCQLAVLAAEVVAPLRPLLSDHEIVVVPTTGLGAVPWGLLPEFRGRPVTVTPSASLWLASRATEPPVGQSLLVGGPRLPHAQREIDRVASVRPDARVLTGADATVEATLHALDGARLAHLVAHGHHNADNVLFSCLDLADGPLMAYDLQSLTAAPGNVVLSACDVGRSDVRIGDEVLGFTAALLYAGTSTVISSPALVSDDLADDVMVAYHQALLAGESPARALAAASATDARIPLICFGAG
jgi:tetratricopeptide (TPR) repeat protein